MTELASTALPGSNPWLRCSGDKAHSRLALVRGSDRYDNIRRALEQLAHSENGPPERSHLGLIDALAGKRRLLIKPNFVVSHSQLAATHVDGVRAVLDFVRTYYSGPITIAEGPSTEPAVVGFRRYGYEPLAKAYDATLMDLNQDEPVPVNVYDRKLNPLRLHVARTVVDSDFRISVGPPKTHDLVIVTASLKNMIMGALISRHSHARPSEARNRPILVCAKKILWRTIPLWIRRSPPAEWFQFRVASSLEPSDKMKMHQSYPVINLNLALLAPLVVPHLAVIDGFEAMEGNGPSAGNPVPLRIALASTDALAADVVAAALMGFSADDIGYLHYCRQLGLGNGDLEQIEIVGNATLAESARDFRPHHAIHRQRRWKLPQAEKYLGLPVTGAWSFG